MDRAGGVMALGADGRRSWSIKLGSEVVGSPMTRDQSIGLVTSDGMLHVRARSDGAERDRMQLGVLSTDGLLGAGSRTILAAGQGTIRTLVAEPASRVNQ
jgi:hypothetical protein